MKYIARITSVTLALAFSLSAAPVTWYLRGATFTDGGLALGSLTYDADTNTYSNLRIFTTPGNDVRSASKDPNVVRAGKDFTVQNFAFAAPTSKRVGIQQSGPTIKITTGYLNLEFTAALTNSGGTVDLSAASGENLFADNGGVIAGPSRSISAGKLIAVAATGPQRWYLNGVTMDDGSLAIGSFVYDASSNTYTQINVQTTQGTTFGAANYTAPFQPPSFNTPVATAANFAVTPGATPSAGGKVLNFALDAPLTNNPGTVTITLSPKTAEGTCSSATCSAGGSVTFGGIVRNLISGSLTTTMPTGYSKVIPHFVDGGKPAWQSLMVISNLSDGPAGYTARFFSTTGAPLNVPGIGTVSTGLVPARGVVFLQSTGTSAATLQGWTRIDNAQNLSVSNQILLQGANSAGDQQGAMYADVMGSNVVTVPFDNSISAANAAKGNSIANGFAVANPDPVNSVGILVVGYDAAGNIVARDSSVRLGPLNQTAFLFSGLPGLTALTKGQGNIKVYAVPDANSTGPLGGINCLLLKFQLPSFSFANIAGTNQ